MTRTEVVNIGSDFVAKDPNTKQNEINLYKIATNENGLVTRTEVVDIGSEVKKVFPVANDSTLGTIKTNSTLNDPDNGKFGVKVDASNKAYVQIPKATTSSYGISKTLTSGTGITINTSNNSVNLNQASTNSLGGIRTGFTTDVNNRNYKVDIKNANAYVNIPMATDTGYGVVCLNDLNFVPLPEPDPEEEDDSLIPGMVQIINTTPVIVQ